MTVASCEKYAVTRAWWLNPLFTTPWVVWWDREIQNKHPTGGIYWFIYWFYRCTGAAGRRDGRRKLSP